MANTRSARFHRIKMKGVDAVLGKLLHLARRDGGGNQLARLGVVIETLEFRREPVGHTGPGTFGEIAGLLEVLHRQNAGHDRNLNAARPHAIKEAEIKIVIEEELRDGARCTGVDLGFEDVRYRHRSSRSPGAVRDRPKP